MATEADLIRNARQGDAGAWEVLTRTHQEPVFRLAYLFLGDPDDAEDIAQETFIRAYFALGSFDDSRPLRPWLFGIAANLARNQRRAAGRYLAHLLRFARRQPAFAPPPEVDENAQIWQAIRRLKPEFQEVLFLRYYLEMPEAEMSESLSVAQGTVKSRLHRALTALRQVIQHDFLFLKDEMV